jgi:NitT/TauT family transport system permease protein
MKHRWLGPTISIAVLLIAWEAAVHAFSLPEYLLPLPSAVAIEMVAEAKYLAPHLAVTSLETILGFLLAVVVGIMLAVLIVASPVLEATIYPLLVGSQSIPKVAIAPLLIFWTGIGLLPKVLIAFLIAFFPIVIDTVVGLRSVEPEMLQLARSMGASQAKTYWKIRFPSALPNIFAGLKVGVTLAVVGAIVGEFIQADRGLGYTLLQANAMLNTKLSFAIVLLLSTLGVVLFLVVDWIERLTIPWHVSRRPEMAAATATA